MSTSRFTIAYLLGAAGAFGQLCNPHPLHPDGREPCLTVADQLSKAAAAGREFNKQVGEMNSGIDAARRRYWAAFPNGPGLAAAEQEFLGALEEKDLYYMMFAIHQGTTGDVAKMANAIAVTGGDLSIKSIDKFPTNVDGGIKPYAFPLFAGWVNKLRRADGREKDGTWANPALLAVAVKDRSNWRRAYEDARNWAEFIGSGKDISKYLTPQVYLRSQMEADVCGVLARAKPADLPRPTAAALDLYNLFVKMFGEKEVVAAADKVLRAPKNSVGGLTPRPDVEVGGYVGAPSPNPYMLFLTEATRSSARAYAIAMAMDANALLADGATVTFNSKAQWDKAFSIYNQLIARYGEANVLAAADRLRMTPKDAQGAILGDPQEQPLRYWFQALLSDPKAAVPDGQVAHFRAASYDPRWVGKFVDVRGTVARVDVDRSGSPLYATIYFRESQRNGITGFTPYSDMLQSSYGNSFAGLVGKPVELLGEVQPWRDGGGVRILNMKQVKVLAADADFRESHPDWLSSTQPAPVSAENPDYLAWKKFPVGTKVTLENRLLTENSPGTDLYKRSLISRMTMRLDSIDNQRAVVTIDSTTYDHDGRGTQSAPTTRTYPANGTPAVPRDSSGVITKGEELLTVSGKKIPTTWESIASENDPMMFTKTWRSKDVPGGLVLYHQQQHSDAGGKPFRTITEYIYAPVDGVTPVLGDAVPAAAPTPATRLNHDVARVTQVRARLAGVTPPSNVRVAASHLDPQLVMAKAAVTHNTSQIAASLDTLEASLKIIEDYLGK